MQFRDRLYIGEGIKTQKVDKLIKKLKHKPESAKIFVITIAGNPKDQLDILASSELKKHYYKSYPPYVIGIAQDRSDAFLLVERIVNDCLLSRGDCQLKEYLLC